MMLLINLRKVFELTISRPYTTCHYDWLCTTDTLRKPRRRFTVRVVLLAIHLCVHSFILLEIS